MYFQKRFDKVQLSLIAVLGYGIYLNVYPNRSYVAGYWKPFFPMNKI